ncbi:hypothetical protein PGT21_031209 [Puccinia graminis f. sp. tritici]|uniref:Uncharacterized protein n=1 Tax=Puccinia graminis f. sp. tritici TaxID=56615 RepID=A0A5B0QU29_PUCGR|nr:hypothetical protein PGT21_031209 [Puccinia graminis f. sp. tritici]KAA1116798.1 hypothetical protein PGTUg99_020693 [Puccinia graminis f. sp. tritici]
MSCNQPSDSRVQAQLKMKPEAEGGTGTVVTYKLTGHLAAKPIPDALLLAWQWQEERSNRSWVRSSRGAIIVPVDNAKYVVA